MYKLIVFIQLYMYVYGHDSYTYKIVYSHVFVSMYINMRRYIAEFCKQIYT